MTEPIGRRIALHRRRRGLSQAAVAGLVGRSESWSSQVERGLRDVDSYAVLRELARVLRVDLAALTGTEPLSNGAARSDQHVAAIERALLLGTAGELHIDVATAGRDLHTAYQRARYGEVLAALPAVVTGLDGRDPSLVAAG